MRLTKYGHSCLLVEEGPARLLLDPGTPPGRPVEVLAVPAGRRG
jgi:L-ascorbate metabolism protein UlaG (beta-lactamase superfamily)